MTISITRTQLKDKKAVDLMLRAGATLRVVR